jgi:AraC-like DNA-binding protein
MTVDAYALAEVLGSIDLRAGVTRKVTLARNASLSLAFGSLVLVYVVEGSVHGHPPLASGCRVRIDASGLVAIATVDGSFRLATGDAFLTLGQQALALEAEERATLIAVDIELADTAAQLTTILPEFIAVTAFNTLEPAAAALAENMGKISPGNCSLRSGDPIICRMMVSTVLLSVIRAWAENGCAPAGWPRCAMDPFLDRVLKAIHAEPGREWTVELLAAVGVMSRSVFAERFRRVVGRTPASYVRQVRMDVAKRMLSAGSTVSETSRQLGYTSDEGFSRAFRRNTGSPPSVW